MVFPSRFSSFRLDLGSFAFLLLCFFLLLRCQSVQFFYYRDLSVAGILTSYCIKFSLSIGFTFMFKIFLHTIYVLYVCEYMYFNFSFMLFNISFTIKRML